jgi:hypothetical protein
VQLLLGCCLAHGWAGAGVRAPPGLPAHAWAARPPAGLLAACACRGAAGRVRSACAAAGRRRAGAPRVSRLLTAPSPLRLACAEARASLQANEKEEKARTLPKLQSQIASSNPTNLNQISAIDPRPQWLTDLSKKITKRSCNHHERKIILKSSENEENEKRSGWTKEA